MKTVADLIAWIDGRFPVGESTATHFSVTGEPYVVIGSQHPDDGPPSIPGTIDECKRGEYATDEEKAAWQARAAFAQYAEGRDGILYWRIRPQFETFKKKKGCGIYMRLLISDKPVMRGPAS